MDYAVSVRMVEGVANLADVVEGERKIERPVARDDVFERVARHELHHDEEDVLLLLRREDRHDVRMVQAREEAGFPQQLTELDSLLVRNLEGNLLVNPRVVGQVDSAEAPAPNCRKDLVFSDDLTAEEHPRGEYTPVRVPAHRRRRIIPGPCTGFSLPRSIPATRPSRFRETKRNT